MYIIIILLFRRLMWSGQWPGARGFGPGLGLKYEIVLWAGLDIIFAGRAGPGPHNSICGPGPGRVCTTAAGPGRAANFFFLTMFRQQSQYDSRLRFSSRVLVRVSRYG